MNNYDKTYRKLTEFDTIYCPISMEQIKDNDEYKICLSCSVTFQLYAIDIWILNTFRCPICRDIWKNNTIYINK